MMGNFLISDSTQIAAALCCVGCLSAGRTAATNAARFRGRLRRPVSFPVSQSVAKISPYGRRRIWVRES